MHVLEELAALAAMYRSLARSHCDIALGLDRDVVGFPPDSGVRASIAKQASERRAMHDAYANAAAIAERAFSRVEDALEKRRQIARQTIAPPPAPQLGNLGRVALLAAQSVATGEEPDMRRAMRRRAAEQRVRGEAESVLEAVVRTATEKP